MLPDNIRDHRKKRMVARKTKNPMAAIYRGVPMITSAQEIQLAIEDLTRLIKASKPIQVTGIDYQNVMLATVELRNAIDAVVRFE
jgi:hypothetical protein